MNPIDKKIFVVGTGRCGTTWIGTWLRQHPCIFGGPETHLFRILRPMVNENWAQGLKTWIGIEGVREIILQLVMGALGNCKFRQREEQIHLVEHSSCHYQEIDFILKLLPDAQFIHPFRNVRDVVESKVRGGGDPKVALQDWIDTMTDMQNRASEASCNSIFNIKYEMLVETPEMSRSITEFLGIEHHKDIDSWEFPINTPHFSYDPNRWKSLPADVIEMIEQNEEAQSLMTELKYASE